ncbi:MAG: hypothetical protein V2J11_05895 [Desulfofustis sp.]|jgi:hypothetical protein|nr:hypothetical protein [Desulfofustis sp.]
MRTKEPDDGMAALSPPAETHCTLAYSADHCNLLNGDVEAVRIIGA